MIIDNTAKKKALSELRHIEGVLRRWDPIGVMPGPNEDEGPMAEYDSYAPGIHTVLRKDGSVEELTRHLENIRVWKMGGPAFWERDLQFANELFTWWQENKAA